MKKFKTVCVAMALLLGMTALSGCFVINSQKMKKVKGTYQLTRYTYTPKYERKEGYTPTTIDYIADRGYEVYLVVTGESKGYYVHKDNQTAAYSKEVSLSYQYSTENTSEIDYVKYMDSTSSEWNEFGVTRNALNYSRPAFDYTELFTKRPMRTEAIDKDWKKVDDATDLSYVKEKMGEIKEYGYEEFKLMGLYELNSYAYTEESEEVLENPYQYCFVAMDTAKGVMTAKVYYALKSDMTARTENYTITQLQDWEKVQVGNMEWTRDETWGNYYYNIIAGENPIKQTIVNIDRDISEAHIAEVIASRMPTE